MKRRPVNEGDILKRLSAGLSEEEIRRVLAGALNSLDQAGVDRLLRRLGVGPQTGTALRRVLDAGNSQHSPAPRKAQIREQWGQTWADLNSRSSQASDSEGAYLI